MSFPIGFRCHLVAILGPNLPTSAPTWPPKPPKNRSKFIVWNHLNLHVRSRCDIDRFFIDFRTLEISKNIEKTNCFLAFLHFRYHRSWDRFCSELGAILDSKIDPKSVPRGSSKVLKIISVLQCLLEPSKINLLANMAPTWPDFAPQDGSKLGLKSVQNRFRSRLRFGSWFWTEFGPMLDRFWTDFGPIVDRCWTDFGWF